MVQHWLQEKGIELILLRLERNFVWACFIMEQIVIYLSMIQEILNLKEAKESEIVATPLWLGNISIDLSIVNIKKIGLNRYVYDFSADYDAIAVDSILDILKYLKVTSASKR